MNEQSLIEYAVCYFFWLWQYTRRNTEYRADFDAKAWRVDAQKSAAVPDDVQRDVPQVVEVVTVHYRLEWFSQKYGFAPHDWAGGHAEDGHRTMEPSSRAILEHVLKTSSVLSLPAARPIPKQHIPLRLIPRNDGTVEAWVNQSGQPPVDTKNQADYIAALVKVYEYNLADNGRSNVALEDRLDDEKLKLLAGEVGIGGKGRPPSDLPRAVGLYLYDLIESGLEEDEAIDTLLHRYEYELNNYESYSERTFLRKKIQATRECIATRKFLPMK